MRRDVDIPCWTDAVPYDPETEGYPCPGGAPYTYRDLALDLAGAQGMDLDEFLHGDADDFPDDLPDEYDY